MVGIKDRSSNRITAKPVESLSKVTVEAILGEAAVAQAPLYTDEGSMYGGLPNHESVNHSAGEYVRGQAHVNGLESFWSLLRRGYYGTFHMMSFKHLERYVNEFAGRHNIRDLDTIQQMSAMAATMDGKRLRYKRLIQGNGQSSGARELAVRSAVPASSVQTDAAHAVIAAIGDEQIACRVGHHPGGTVQESLDSQSPRKPCSPVPAAVEMIPVASMFRTR